MGAEYMGIHEQIPIQARVKATLAPSPQRLHRSCQSTIVDSHQYPATNLKLKQSIIPLRIQPIPPWSESESHCDKQTSSETKIQPQTAKRAAVPKNLSETGRRDSNNSQREPSSPTVAVEPATWASQPKTPNPLTSKPLPSKVKCTRPAAEEVGIWPGTQMRWRRDAHRMSLPCPAANPATTHTSAAGAPQTSSSHPPPTSRPRRRTMPSGRVLWAMIGVRMGGRAWSLVRLQGREG